MKRTFIQRLRRALAGAILGCCAVHNVFAEADDKPAAKTDAPPPPVVVKQNADGEAVVTLSAATAKLIKLETANPAAASWQAELTAYGRVLDPAHLEATMAELATALLAESGSSKDLKRTEILAAQTNASPKALEAATLAYTHDKLAVESLQTALNAEWQELAGREDLPSMVRALAARQMSLVKLILPAGEQLTEEPSSAGVTVFPADSSLIPAKVLQLNFGTDPQTLGQIVLCAVEKRWLPLNAAVTGHFHTGGAAQSGVAVPAAAVLRHEGMAWFYVQTAPDQYTRRSIALEKLTEKGWFVGAGLAATNAVVTGGAETLLSAEMGGGFNTGTRD